MGRYRQRRFPSPCGWRCGDRQTPADREACAGAAGPSAALGTPRRQEIGAASLRSRVRRGAGQERQDGVGDSVQARQGRRYALRHTCASWLVAKGLPTRKIADFLGTSESMIIKHYGHLAPDYQNEAALAIGRK